MVPFTFSLLPTLSDITGLALAWLTAIIFALAGRTVSKKRFPLELEMVAGWGIASALLTVAGFFAIPLYYGFAPLLLLAALGIYRGEYGKEDGFCLLITAIAALPLLVVIAGINLWQSDSFAFWLPNYDHILRNHVFPTQEISPRISYYYAFPYNLQFAGYISSWGTERFKSLLHFNIILNLAAALFITRLILASIRGNMLQLTALSQYPKAWLLAFWGMLAVTYLNPSFVPSLNFSSYGDISTGIVLMMASHCLIRLLAAEEEPGALAILLALLLLAFINIKQSNLSLFMIMAGAGLITSLVSGRSALGRYARYALPAFLPALLLYTLWRVYVQHYLPGEENLVLPIAQWHYDSIPSLLQTFGQVALKKSGLFSLYVIIFITTLVLLFKQRPLEYPLLPFTTLMILGYTLFLLVIYISTLVNNGHSYWRFNTHLGLLCMITLLPYLCRWLTRTKLFQKLSAQRISVMAFCIVCVALPFATIHSLRYDMEAPKPFIRETAPEIAALLGKGDKLAIISAGDKPDDNFTNIRGLILLNRPDIEIAFTKLPEDEAYSGKYHAVLVSCQAPRAALDTSPLMITLYKTEPGNLYRQIKTWPAPAELCIKNRS